MSIENLRKAAILSFVASLALLLGEGHLAKDQVPPCPGEILESSTNRPGLDYTYTTTRRLKAVEIREGESVWQRLNVEL